MSQCGNNELALQHGGLHGLHGGLRFVEKDYWNLEMLIFEERGKLESPENNLSEQSKEPTTNLTHT